MGLVGKAKRDTNDIGNMSESAIAARFIQPGYSVSIPFGGNQRYDMIVEDTEGKLWRIQCKTARIDEGGTVIDFDTANHNVTGVNREKRHYRGQCEHFAVYCEKLNKIYLIPVDEVGIVRAKLRLTPPKNKQVKYVRWAKDYEL